jgi:hypothetical protein
MATIRTLMNEAHPEYLGWQIDWPLYVKVPVLNVQGKVYSKGDYLPWAELKLDPSKIAQMYRQKMVYHNSNFAKEDGYGDRLGEIKNTNLRGLVQMMNHHLKKEHCATEEEFKKKRCRQSNVGDTQRRFIRQFLAKNPYMSDYFLSIRDNYIVKVIDEPEKEEKQDGMELQSEQSGN